MEVKGEGGGQYIENLRKEVKDIIARGLTEGQEGLATKQLYELFEINRLVVKSDGDCLSLFTTVFLFLSRYQRFYPELTIHDMLGLALKIPNGYECRKRILRHCVLYACELDGIEWIRSDEAKQKLCFRLLELNRLYYKSAELESAIFFELRLYPEN